MMVAMNPQTWDADVAELEPGGYLFYDSTRPLPPSKFRDDIHVIGMPLTEICNAVYTDPRQRQLFKNIVYVGALSVLLEIEPDGDREAVRRAVQGQGKAAGLQRAGAAPGPRLRAASTCSAPLGIRVRRADRVGDQIFVDGNSAAALGCVYGGATVAAWYPITPSSSVAEAFQKYCGKFRVDPATGQNRYAIVQAEDEIASIGMVVGAGWNGARAFTATSGPGVSLMTEFIGLAYFAEIPVTIINVQRGGPSTGMPTRTQQADILSCAYASHGDTKHVLLFPEDPHECFEHAAAALDLADRLQTPVFLMTDLDIGMNQRLCEPFAWDDGRAYDRGKVMTAEELEAGSDFGRYKDVDGDGIPWRTLPGTHPTKGSYFTRGTTRDAYARYSERGPGLHLQHGAAAAQVRDRGHAGAAAGAAAAPRSKTRAGRDLFRLDQPGDARGAGGAGGRRHPPRRAAAARLSVPGQRGASSSPQHEQRVRGRAEPRRADAQPAGQRTRHRSGAAGQGAALRRHADHRALHHQAIADHGTHQCRPPRGGSWHDLHRQAPAAPPDAGAPTRSATRGATTRARSPRCAPAAATTRSRPPSSRPAGSWTSSRTAWPSCRASAAAPRRPTTSWAPRTASTPCTAACPRC